VLKWFAITAPDKIMEWCVKARTTASSEQVFSPHYKSAIESMRQPFVAPRLCVIKKSCASMGKIQNRTQRHNGAKGWRMSGFVVYESTHHSAENKSQTKRYEIIPPNSSHNLHSQFPKLAW
jgi:hypothetical protein